MENDIDKTGGKPTGAMREANGKVSAMRLMCVCSLFASMVFGYFTVDLLKNKEVTADKAMISFYITSFFLAGAFAPKGIQKVIETKVGVSK